MKGEAKHSTKLGWHVLWADGSSSYMPDEETAKHCASPIRQPPELEIDKRLNPNRDLPARCYVERRIVWNLLLHLKALGFEPLKVISDEAVKTPTARAVMEEAFNLDDCLVEFTGGRTVTLVFGNDGTDCISDWNYGKGDPDGFNAAVEAFKPEQFA